MNNLRCKGRIAKEVNCLHMQELLQMWQWRRTAPFDGTLRRGHERSQCGHQAELDNQLSLVGLLLVMALSGGLVSDGGERCRLFQDGYSVSWRGSEDTYALSAIFWW